MRESKQAWWCGVAALGWLALAGGLSPAARGQVGTKPSLRDLAWLSGTWALETPRGRTEEHWMDVGGNMILGVSRTLAGGKTVFFEFLRIEERADGIYYVAQPQGRPGTAFKLTKLDGHHATFESPTHDFPKRILYSRNPDGSLTARIDAGEGSRRAREFPYKPRK